MSRNNTQREGVIEQAKMDIMSLEMDNLYDHISKEQLKQVLDKYFKDVPSVEELPNGDDLFNLKLTTLDEYGNNTINVYEIYNGKIE